MEQPITNKPTQPSITIDPQPSLAMQIPKKGFPLVLVVILFILFVIFTGIVLGKYLYGKRVISPTTTQPFIVPTQTPDLTADWKSTNEVKILKKDIVNYFNEVVLMYEYNPNNNKQVVTKWNKQDVCIKTIGNSNDYLMKCMENVIKDFNNLSTTTKLNIKESCDDIIIYIVPYEKFKSILPEFDEKDKNYGFFWNKWDDNYIIYNSTILINSNESDKDVERCHLIREELTQAMGLPNDSNKYKDSIFYKDFNPTLYYLDIDKEIIKLLYSGNIKAGMTKDDTDKLLNKNN